MALSLIEQNALLDNLEKVISECRYRGVSNEVRQRMLKFLVDSNYLEEVVIGEEELLCKKNVEKNC